MPLDTSRPMDSGAENRNSDDPRGPLRATSFGCTDKPCWVAFTRKSYQDGAYSSSKASGAATGEALSEQIGRTISEWIGRRVRMMTPSDKLAAGVLLSLT